MSICGCNNWEFANKRAFRDMVLAYIIKSGAIDGLSAANAMHKVHCCKAGELPVNLPKAFREFVAWLFDGGAKPSWYETPLMGDVA